MRLVIIASTIYVFSSTVFALAEEPSASEACAYFARDIPVEVPSANTQFSVLGELDFRQVDIQLDRYVLLATVNDVVVDFGRSDQNGQIQVGGRISASIFCLVDQNLRRVLEIRVMDGPNVGRVFRDDFGREREIVGPRAEVFIAADDVRNGLY